MSSLLWKYYLEDDIDKFRHLLANASHASPGTPKSYGGATAFSAGSMGARVESSPSGYAASPSSMMRSRKTSGQMGNAGGTKGNNNALSRAEINNRDYAGLTLLHRVVSSNAPKAVGFALTLIEHPAIDLYAQDPESGWTALHRALYFGNVRVAHAIIGRDTRDRTGLDGSAVAKLGSSVIKVKDHEGNSPFDVYNATIARRSVQAQNSACLSDSESQDDHDDDDQPIRSAEFLSWQDGIIGDEVFMFGSNKNFSLGFADQDDRQHPERITLKRPSHLLFRFFQEHLRSCSRSSQPRSFVHTDNPMSGTELPSMTLSTPIVIQDVQLSKLHSAVLTRDPESNLHICGFGPGGRLGTGDETTRFMYVPIDQGGLAGKNVTKVALGQNHTLAVSASGEIFSWGTNTWGQLGYTLPQPVLKDEEPVCVTPRQIFGPLKRENVIGVAASAIHSIAYTLSSLYCWGKNEGQLGLMDSDSRSLEVQATPRKVAASLFKTSIISVSAINGASTVLLANHTVYVFTNYGYNIVKFPLNENFSHYHLQSTTSTRYDGGITHITAIESGGETIAAISSRGDLFVMTVRKTDLNDTAVSTTNPNKIKSALSPPQRIWSLRKGNWDGIKSVGIGENGSVIVCTQGGAVWRRIKRPKVKDAFASSSGQSYKEFKFQRVPGLTKITTVRSTPFGVYAAVRKDSDIMKTQIAVSEQNLWQDIGSLLSIKDFEASDPPEDGDTNSPRFWAPSILKEHSDTLKRAVLTSPDLELDMERHVVCMTSPEYNLELSTTNSVIRIPVHGFILAGRSPIIRSAYEDFRHSGRASILDVLKFEQGTNGRAHMLFQGLDILSIINLVVYCYTDTIIDAWHFTRQNPPMAFRYRQARVELMKVATQLRMSGLESAVRLMTEPAPQLNIDIALAIQDKRYFDDSDVIVELEGSEMLVHSAFLCQRCPFFEGLFKGRAAGQWLAGRRQNEHEPIRVDLKHIATETFRLILRYLYADAGAELFDDVVCTDIDEFSERVMDVLAAADELMLDRLSQICQLLLGRFVTTSNICHILNAVAPCSVTAFQDAALEYICLQLEAMLESHLLDDLDNDLFNELDEVVRDNQLNCLPYAKNGRAELVLSERHPSLAQDIDEERRRRIRDMMFQAYLRDNDTKLSTSSRPRIGSMESFGTPTPGQDKSQRGSNPVRNAPFSPNLRSMNSKPDLMFDMDEDVSVMASKSGSPNSGALEFRPPETSRNSESIPQLQTQDQREQPFPGIQSPVYFGPRKASHVSVSTSKTWCSPMLPPSRLDMKEIMAQTSSSQQPTPSIPFSEGTVFNESSSRVPRLSQKERKKQQQQALLQRPSSGQPSPSPRTLELKPISPWQVAAVGSKTNLKDLFDTANAATSSTKEQEVKLASPVINRTSSPDTRFSGQRRPTHTSSSNYLDKAAKSPSPLSQHPKASHQPSAEPSLQMSMRDIIGQQEREIEVRREALTKRSLTEIQEEQAFQEWWDEESKRVREEGQREIEKERRRNEGRDRGKGKERGRAGRSRGRARGKGDERVEDQGKAGGSKGMNK